MKNANVLPGYMANDTIFITGGSGFIGGALLHCLSAMSRPHVVLDRVPVHDESVEFREVDVGSLDECVSALRGARCVVHLAGLVAGPANSNPYDAVMVNVGGTANVLEAAARSGVQRVVLASTFFVYEDCDLDEVDESSPLDMAKMGPFARSKFVCEALARDYGQKSALSIATLRFGSVYGPGAGTNVICQFVQQAIAGELIEVWGSGARHRQFIHVDDVAAAIVKAIQCEATGVFNIAGRAQTTTRQVLEYIKRHLPATRFEFDTSKPERVQSYRMRLERARADLGYWPQISIEEGIGQLVRSESDDS